MDEKRLAGVVLPLFSLRRNNDHGIGDLTALRQWIDWAADAHVGFLQLLPVNALGRDDRTLATVTMGQEDGKFQSFLVLYHTDSDKEIASTPVDGGVAYALETMQREFCAVT